MPLKIDPISKDTTDDRKNPVIPDLLLVSWKMISKYEYIYQTTLSN
jgi:hypothetical protein